MILEIKLKFLLLFFIASFTFATKLPRLKSRRGSITGLTRVTSSAANRNSEATATGSTGTADTTSINPSMLRDNSNLVILDGNETEAKQESVNIPNNQQPQTTNSQIARALAILPSLFGMPSSSSKYQPSVCNSIKEEEKPKRRNSSDKKSLKLFEILSPRLNSNSNAQDQLKSATDQLLNFMKANSEPSSSSTSIYKRKSRNVKFGELTDKTVLEILATFPRKSVPFDLILTTLTKIWSKVQTLLHRSIFEEVVTWAISIIERDFPTEFWNLLDQILLNNFQFTTYQKAIKKARYLLTKDQVRFLTERLLQQFLEPKETVAAEGGSDHVKNEDNTSEVNNSNVNRDNHNTQCEYKFYGKFNIHFMELAINYPNFHDLDFIKNLELPINLTPTLKLIYKSTELLKVFDKPPFDPSEVNRILSGLSEICLEIGLPILMLIEQLQIILSLNQETFEHFEPSDKIVLMNLISETINNFARTIGLYPEIPDKAAYALIVQGDFDAILKLSIKILNPIFTVKEFGFILNLADALNPKKPDGTLLTLLGSITIQRAAWSCSDAFMERSLRLHMYIETILSIQDQKLANDDEYVCTSNLRLSKSRIIEWKLPRAIDRNSYEIITTADLLVIPLLFIQRVLQRDYRKSTVIDKYLRSGKPNYQQFPKIINEILEDQCYGINYQFPLIEVIPKFPESRRLNEIG